MHSSIKMNVPCEPINIVPLNPLISKCQIKVCYVGDEPNRNKSIITKETARQLANSIPGSPIVGYYNELEGDFEEHNREIHISNGTFKITDATRPYGFVDLGAKVWFQKFLDDGVNEHEYLMTEGYLWTGQYPEAQRIIEQGNNQSMELDSDTIDAYWTKDENGKPQFFIINEAIMEKLCILGENCEPCFEGASITDVQFSFDDGFKEQLFSMMTELKELLQKGGAKVFTTYAVEMGDSLFCKVYDLIVQKYPDPKEKWCSMYRLAGIFEEDAEKFAILQCKETLKYFKLSFSYDDTNGFIPVEELVEVTQTFVAPENPQFALEDLENFEIEYKKQKDEDKNNESDNKDSEENVEDEESKDESEKQEPEDKGKDEDKDEKNKKKTKYILEGIPEYVELISKYSDLESKYNNLNAEKEELESQVQSLGQFKLKTERVQKEKMINETFYMLSDGDKKEVIDNIDNYSLDDIEAKLSVICVRNKVSFASLNDDSEDDQNTDPTTYNLGGDLFQGEDSTPAWVKAVLETQQKH